jgi:hypothetical protein
MGIWNRSTCRRVPFHLPDVQVSIDETCRHHCVRAHHSQYFLNPTDARKQYHLGSDLHVPGCTPKLRQLRRRALHAWFLRRRCLAGVRHYHVNLVSEA